jgi:oligopeptidase B
MTEPTLAPSAPSAARRPVTTTLHGDTRVDDFAWLREKENPEVIAYLEAENAYTASMMTGTEALQESVFQEIKARVQETDLSLPVRKGAWSYLTRTLEGSQYPIHLRRPRDREADETADVLLLDENVLAGEADYFSLGTFEPSPDHSLLAWGTDTDGAELYDMRFTKIDTGEVMRDLLVDTSPGVVWSASGNAVLYLTLDDLMRPFQVWRHVLGTDQSQDEMLCEETDERFYLSLAQSSTDEFIIVTSGSQVTSDVRVMRTTAADKAGATFTMVEPRRDGIEYTLDHHRAVDGSERFVVVTNDGCESFRLCVADVTNPGAAGWVDMGLHADDGSAYPVKLDGLEVFQHHLVLGERADAVERFRIVTLDDGGAFVSVRTVTMDEPVYSVWSGGNPEFAVTSFRFGYTSLVTPPTIFEEDLATGNRVMLKQQPVLGDFDPKTYVCERIWAPATDGELIPVSVVRRADTPVDGSAALMLYGYGSYEVSIDPTFSTMRLSLMDRGMVIAVAHIRGGGERGRRWYLNGKFHNKRNTFTDFIDVADHLVDIKLCAPDRIVARGGSAGGLLMGAVLNARPERWRAIVAEVPFVDVVTTMLDETLPLTQLEWEEWGNPNEADFYAYMRSYSPYDNVQTLAYPDIFVSAGLNDPRVGFWEPAKWVAKLRLSNTGSNRLLLKTEMGAGHGGQSGRYSVWRDEAQVYAFMLTAVGITK